MKPQSSLNLNRMYPSGTGSSLLILMAFCILAFLSLGPPPPKMSKGLDLFSMAESGLWVKGCLAGSNVGLGLGGPRWKGFGMPGNIIPGGKKGGMPGGRRSPGGTPWGPPAAAPAAAAPRISPANGELAKPKEAAAANEVGGGGELIDVVGGGGTRLSGLFSCLRSNFSTSRGLDLLSSAKGSLGMPSPLRSEAKLELAEVGKDKGEDGGSGEGDARDVEAGLLSERPGEV